MRQLITKFLVRWVVSALGLWIASRLLGPEHLSVGEGWGTVAGAGFFMALVNMALKPILIVLSIPALIFSLGLFMLVINGLLVLIAAWLYDPLYVSGLGVAIVAGLIIGLVNYLVSRVLEEF